MDISPRARAPQHAQQVLVSGQQEATGRSLPTKWRWAGPSIGAPKTMHCPAAVCAVAGALLSHTPRTPRCTDIHRTLLAPLGLEYQAHPLPPHWSACTPPSQPQAQERQRPPPLPSGVGGCPRRKFDQIFWGGCGGGGVPSVKKSLGAGTPLCRGRRTRKVHEAPPGDRPKDVGTRGGGGKCGR